MDAVEAIEGEGVRLDLSMLLPLLGEGRTVIRGNYAKKSVILALARNKRRGCKLTQQLTYIGIRVEFRLPGFTRVHPAAVTTETWSLERRLLGTAMGAGSHRRPFPCRGVWLRRACKCTSQPCSGTCGSRLDRTLCWALLLQVVADLWRGRVWVQGAQDATHDWRCCFHFQVWRRRMEH
jgi:hypothetical protein